MPSQLDRFIAFFKREGVRVRLTEYVGDYETDTYWTSDGADGDDAQKQFEYNATLTCAQVHFLFKGGVFVGTLADEMRYIEEPVKEIKRAEV